MHLERGSLNLERLRLFLDRASQVGLSEIGVTEHLYRFQEARAILWTDRVAGYSVQRAGEYLTLAEEARSEGLPVKFGLEADYVPGKEDEIERVLSLFPLDFVIGSVHWLDGWAFDLDPATWQGRDVAGVYRQYYETLGEAAESGLFDIIGHPGNIAYHGIRLDAQHGVHPGSSLQSDLEEAFLERAARVPVVLEINSGGLLRPARELFPRPQVAQRIAEMGLPISTASDAHRPEDVGHDFPNLYRQLREWGFTEVTGFSRRRRVSHPLAQE